MRCMPFENSVSNLKIGVKTMENFMNYAVLYIFELHIIQRDYIYVYMHTYRYAGCK